MYIVGKHSTIRKIKDPVLSDACVAPTLEVRTVAMLVLLTVGNGKSCMVFGCMMFISRLMKIRQVVQKSLGEGDTHSPDDDLNLDFIIKYGNYSKTTNDPDGPEDVQHWCI